MQRITFSLDDGTVEKLKQIGEEMLRSGVDVSDIKHPGRTSLSAVIREMVGGFGSVAKVVPTKPPAVNQIVFEEVQYEPVEE